MADDLRLRVVLDMVEKVVAPLKRVSQGSTETARALKATSDRLKELNAQQGAVENLRKQQAEYVRLNNAVKARTALLEGMRAGGTASAAQLKREEAAVQKLATALKDQTAVAGRARAALNAMGVTGNLSAAQTRLTADITQTNAAMRQQRAELKRLGDLRAAHGKAMLHTGMVAGAGVGMMAAGTKIASPLRATISAFMPAEEAETQLRVSMMDNAGKVPQQYKEIQELATRLGDRLPGTTADFIEMMTTLRRQGISAKSILGGTGESAAYLGVQLKMPAAAAAEFAAKMQDATQTTEGDMMGLMDTIQRTFYMGVDPTNMLQGFTKMSSVMPLLGKKGLEASKMLAPLLVMMDQSGMAGESAGNAIRKVVQLGMDRDKVDKANAMLAKEGIKLNFSTKEGKFAGLDNLFAQLNKLKAITNDERRIAAMKKLFGDDAETHQVLNTMMEKGIDGYREAAEKMEAQADLRRRVNEALGTVGASAEAAQGSFTNMLKDMGATIAPDLVKILNALGSLASGVGAWVRENAGLVRWGMLAVGALSAIVTVAGAAAIAFASVAGPMLVMRFLFERTFGISMLGMLGRFMGVLRIVGVFMMANPIFLALALLAGAAFLIWKNWDGIKGGLVAIWDNLGGSVGAVLQTIGAAIVNWSPVGLFYRAFAAVMSYFGVELPATFTGFGRMMMQGLVAGIVSAYGVVRDAVVGAATSARDWFKETLGIKSPSRVFMQAGADVGAGAALGIQAGSSGVRDAALGLAAAAAAVLPLPAFSMEAPELQAALMQPPAVRAAQALALPEVPQVGQPSATAPVRIDQRPGLTAPGAARSAGQAMPAATSTYHITITAAPGMDAQAMARAIRAELDRRDWDNRSAVRSSFHDIG